MTAGGGVGVLAILDREISDSIENNQFTSGSKWAAELRAARAAIAELIAADKEFDEARAEFESCACYDEGGASAPTEIVERLNAATARRASALAALESNA